MSNNGNCSVLRVLFLNSRSELGGSDLCLLEIIKHLDKSKIVPLVMLPGPGPLVDDLLQAGAVQIIYGEMNPLERPESLFDIFKFLVRMMPTSLRIASLIWRNSIDVVYTNSSAIQTGAIAAAICHKPHVWHIREIWSSPRVVGQILYWFVYHFAARIITISNAVRSANFPTRISKITTIYDGVDIDSFGEPINDYQPVKDFGIPDDAKIVGVVGRLVPLKGHKLLLDAVRQLILEHDDVHLVIIGDIPKPIYQIYRDELNRYVIENGIARNVHFIGWSRNIPAWLRSFTVLVLPSIHPEGLGVVIPEAWASRVPVIASNHGGPSEIIKHGINGVLFDPGDVDGLRRAITLVVSDRALRERLIDGGGISVRNHFNAVENTRLIQDVLLSVVRTV